jgi:hypothetical protein
MAYFWLMIAAVAAGAAVYEVVTLPLGRFDQKDKIGRPKQSMGLGVFGRRKIR